MALKCHGVRCFCCRAHYWWQEPHDYELCTTCLYKWDRLNDGWILDAIAKTVPWPDDFQHSLADFVLGGVRYRDNIITRKLASMYMLLTGPYSGRGVYWNRLIQTGYVRESPDHYNAAHQLRSDLLMHILSYIITPSLSRGNRLDDLGPSLGQFWSVLRTAAPFRVEHRFGRDSHPFSMKTAEALL